MPTDQITDDEAVALAKDHGRSVTVRDELPAFDDARVHYRFYRADGAGATPNQMRCVVTVAGGMNPGARFSKDLALADLGPKAEAILARIYLAAISDT